MELFSDCSWKKHIEITEDFCVLIVYPIILVNLFISSNSCGAFLINSPGFSLWKMMLRIRSDHSLSRVQLFATL